jgi:NAD(P)-dependent dehydrogenase (short-subunit alcohol dehydrogenase family)
MMMWSHHHDGQHQHDGFTFIGGSVYALRKVAIARFTRGLARNLADRRVIVNNSIPI